MQDRKQESEISSIVEGREIVSSDKHPKNADLPSLESLELDSNVNSERLLHLMKQPLDIASIDEGKQIDLSAEQLPNANSPRFEI
jgi:hypothetical protein